ncbi:MAG: hypothetical protein ABSD97_15285 [Acidimicrobiales bacterium]|jgi:hypothetical protein
MLAGAVGTSAMDALLYRRYRRGGGSEQPLNWEFSAGVKTWEDVSAPGLVGKYVLQRLQGEEPPPEWARSLQNTVHWATGVGWSLPLALVVPQGKRFAWRCGVAIGPIAWITSYVVLPFAKIYKPIWDYDAKTLADDLTAHLVYGMTIGTVLAVAAKPAPGATPGCAWSPGSSNATRGGATVTTHQAERTNL